MKCEGSGGEMVRTYATNAGLVLIELIGWALRHPHPPKVPHEGIPLGTRSVNPNARKRNGRESAHHLFGDPTLLFVTLTSTEQRLAQNTLHVSVVLR